MRVPIGVFGGGVWGRVQVPVEKRGKGKGGGRWGVGWGKAKGPASQCARVCQNYGLANYPLVLSPIIRFWVKAIVEASQCS